MKKGNRIKLPLAANVLVGTQVQTDLETPTTATDLPTEFLVPGLLAKVLSFGFGGPLVCRLGPTWFPCSSRNL